MKQVETAYTTQIWRAALCSTKDIEGCVTPYLLRDYLNTAYIPDPILALVLDRLVSTNGREFLMEDAYKKVLYGIMRRAERVFYMLRLSPIPLRGRVSNLMGTISRAMQGIDKFIVEPFQSVITGATNTDVIDVITTDKSWDDILWLDNGNLINKNRIDAAILLLYISPWAPLNRTGYLARMDEDNESNFYANIVMDPQKLSFFLADHTYYDEDSIAYSQVRNTIEAYLYAVMPDYKLKPGLWKTVVEVIWRMLHYEIQTPSELYESVFVMTRDVPRIKELCKKYHEIPNPRDASSFLPCKQYKFINRCADAYMLMLEKERENEDEVISKMGELIYAVTIADSVPIVYPNYDASPIVWRARAFMNLVRDHVIDSKYCYSAAFHMILTGIEAVVPRDNWIAAMASVTAKDIEQIPTLDIDQESKKRLYGRLAQFYLNNTTCNSLMTQVVSTYKIDIKESEVN